MRSSFWPPPTPVDASHTFVSKYEPMSESNSMKRITFNSKQCGGIPAFVACAFGSKMCWEC